MKDTPSGPADRRSGPNSGSTGGSAGRRRAGADVTARCTAVWPLARRLSVSDSGPGVRQPYVSRGPRPRTCRGPCRHDGAAGPYHPDAAAPRPSRRPTAIRASSWRDRVAVASPRPSTRPQHELAVAQRQRRAVRRRCPSRRAAPSARGPSHRSAGATSRGPGTTRATSRPNGCGSRSSGPGPDHRRRLLPARATPDRSAAARRRGCRGLACRPQASRARSAPRGPGFARSDADGFAGASEGSTTSGRSILVPRPGNSPGSPRGRSTCRWRSFRCSSPVEPKLSTVSTTLSTALGDHARR